MNTLLTLILIFSGGCALHSVAENINVTETTKVVSQSGAVNEYSEIKKLIEDKSSVGNKIEEKTNMNYVKNILKHSEEFLKKENLSDESKDYIKIIIEDDEDSR